METEYQVITFHQVAGKLSGKGRKKFVTFLTIFASIGIGLGFALANYVYLILALKELLNWNTRACSFLVFCVLIIILWKVIEPERIKPIAIVLSLIIFGSGNNFLH
jgi:glucan phosphoethanolaminetransferase (alkaline phosphatase superfamily)